MVEGPSDPKTVVAAARRIAASDNEGVCHEAHMVDAVSGRHRARSVGPDRRRVEAGTLVAVGAVIVCPLMMLLMMGGGMHRLARRHQGDQELANTSPAEDVTTPS